MVLLVWQGVLGMRRPCGTDTAEHRSWNARRCLSRRLELNLTVVSSRMELNFEPNSSVLSCAGVRGEKKRQRHAEKR